MSLMGFERGGGSNLGFSIDLHRRPYNTLALPCECVMTLYLYVVPFLRYSASKNDVTLKLGVRVVQGH